MKTAKQLVAEKNELRDNLKALKDDLKDARTERDKRSGAAKARYTREVVSSIEARIKETEEKIMQLTSVRDGYSIAELMDEVLSAFEKADEAVKNSVDGLLKDLQKECWDYSEVVGQHLERIAEAEADRSVIRAMRRGVFGDTEQPITDSIDIIIRAIIVFSRYALECQRFANRAISDYGSTDQVRNVIRIIKVKRLSSDNSWVSPLRDSYALMGKNAFDNLMWAMVSEGMLEEIIEPFELVKQFSSLDVSNAEVKLSVDRRIFEIQTGRER